MRDQALEVVVAMDLDSTILALSLMRAQVRASKMDLTAS
jgi:hypothetical protein